MKKARGLGHVSAHHAFQQAVVDFLDSSDATGSIVSAAFEKRLDILEDSNTGLTTTVSDLSASISGNVANILVLSGSISNNVSEIISLSSSVSSSVTSLSSSIFYVSSNVATISSSHHSLSSSFAALSSSYTSLSQSFALLSASIAEGGGLVVDIDDDAELLFDGDTLMTNADVYISGSGNNLYLHGTNTQGAPAKFEFSIKNGQTYIAEVPHSDFGDSVDDPWFRFDGETLLTHADIYVSGANNYLYMNGTDENGDYGIFYFDIINGQVHIKQTGSV